MCIHISYDDTCNSCIEEKFKNALQENVAATEKLTAQLKKFPIPSPCPRRRKSDFELVRKQNG